MRRRIMTFILLAHMISPGIAQAKSFPQKCVSALEQKLKSARSTARKDYFKRLIDNTRRVKREIATKSLWANQPIACYTVPAISPRKRLPDVLPVDGQLSNNIQIIGAKGEFVPASIVVFPFENIEKMQLKCTDLEGVNDTIPASAVDLKVVKCWYQCGTGWHSYFNDPTRAVLIPELLLNDETLVKVDHEKKENYLRVDYPSGSKYRWMSYPVSIAPKICFNIFKEPVSDSPTLLPVKLKTGECKQFWLTINIPAKISAGFYRGTVTLNSGGKIIGSIELDLRVLPFTLPVPKTYYDLDRDFIVSIYEFFMGRQDLNAAGNDKALLKRQVIAMLKNMMNHNVRQFDIGSQDPEMTPFYYDAMKEAGVNFDMVFGPYVGHDYPVVSPLQKGKEPPVAAWDDFVKRHDKLDKFCKKNLPNTKFYSWGGSEIRTKTLVATARTAKHLAEMGVYNYVDMHLKHLIEAGCYNVDLFNTSYNRNAASDGEDARMAHALGLRMMSYASPHCGPENPCYIRRTHGIMLYKSDYDGVRQCSYKPKLGNSNCWAEFAKRNNYRITFIYPTREGVIDTLHWEGFREGIDDVRYATKLLQLARDAIATGDVEKRYTARKAMQYLACLDWRTANLDAARLEMINYIIKIQKLLKGEAS